MRLFSKYVILWYNITKRGGQKVTALNPEEYTYRSSIFENSLDNNYKKENGIFYTDIKLATKIIKSLYIPSKATIFDPCCGLGSFIIAAQNLNFKNIYGADLDKTVINLCRKYTGISNIKTSDTLFISGKEVLKNIGLKNKVDYVIGNPPYVPMDKNITINTEDYSFLRKVKDSGNNLFVAAIYRAFELTSPDGFISYIVPKNMLHVASYSLLRRTILYEKRIVSIIDIGAYFKDVRGEQIIITIQNKFTENNKIIFQKYKNNEFIETLKVKQCFYKDEILLFSNKDDFNIYCKLENNYTKFRDICTGYVGRGKSLNPNAVSGKDIKKFGFKNRKVPKKGNQVFIQNIYSAEAGIIASFAGNLEASQTVTVFTDGDEKMCHYITGILQSRLCNYYLLKFCYNNSKLTMHTDAKYLKKIPLVHDKKTFTQVINLVKSLGVVKYMSDEWFELFESLNDLIYKIYDINEKEAEYIDSEMRSLQSKRWDNGKKR
jgi:methylase of polypeptide subunit release factors